MTEPLSDKHYVTTRNTQHYEYKLNFEIKATQHGYTSAHLYVGNPADPCLSISIPLYDSLHNNRYNASDLAIATLNKIKDMKECILSGTGPSFSKEMLHDVFQVIRERYPQIHHVSLDDTSFIPCGEADTLDLLRYSVALYGKTWYELNFNAYLVPRDKFIEYKCKVYEYSKKETKETWPTFLKLVYSKLNTFAKDYFNEHADSLEKLYNASESYPAFFQGLSARIEKSDKCRFFKGWFETFIESFVVVPRSWYIDLYYVNARARVKRGGTRKNRRT